MAFFHNLELKTTTIATRYLGQAFINRKRLRSIGDETKGIYSYALNNSKMPQNPCTCSLVAKKISKAKYLTLWSTKS